MVELLPKALEKYNRNPERLSGSALSRIASSGRRGGQARKDQAGIRTA
jgi:hypothetical protein